MVMMPMTNTKNYVMMMMILRRWIVTQHVNMLATMLDITHHPSPLLSWILPVSVLELRLWLWSWLWLGSFDFGLERHALER